MQTAQRVRALAKELNNSALAGGSLPRLAGTLYYLSAFQSARRSATRGARQTNRLPPRKSARPRLAVCAILMVPCETVRQSVRGRWGGCPANHDGRGLSLQEVLLFLIERKSFATRLGSKGVRVALYTKTKHKCLGKELLSAHDTGARRAIFSSTESANPKDLLQLAGGIYRSAVGIAFVVSLKASRAIAPTLKRSRLSQRN